MSAGANGFDDSPFDRSRESTQPGTLIHHSSQNSSFHGRHRRHSDPCLPDLLGNLPLHHAFAHYPELEKIRSLLKEYAHGASLPNQFGRLPLHYAMDHSRINVEAVKLLLEAFPGASSTRAADGMTPYDICTCTFTCFSICFAYP